MKLRNRTYILLYTIFFFNFLTLNILALSGTVVESGNGIGVWGALIQHTPSGLQVRTDKQGKFSLNLPSEGGNLVIKRTGFWPRNIPVPKDKNIILRISLANKTPIKLEKVVVRRKNTEISKKRINSSQIRRSTSNVLSDTLKIIQKLPGVVSSGDFTSLLYIRGGNFYEAVAFLDDFQIINPYIFGAGTSVFNPNLVDTVDFYTGGFPSRFGQAMSGVIDVNIRNGSTSNTHGLLELTAATFEGVLEGPLGNDKRSSYIVGLRRTHYDLTFGPAVVESGEGTTLPYFYDGQAKFNIAIGKSTFLAFNSLVSYEGANFNFTEEQTTNTSREIEQAVYKNLRILQGVRLQTALNKKTSLKATLGYKYQDLDTSLASTTQPLIIKNKTHEFQARADLSYKAGDKLKLKTGIYNFALWSDLNLLITQKILLSQTNTTNAQYYEEDLTINYQGKGWWISAFYASAEYQPLSWLTLSLGSRLEYFTVNKSFDISPRFGLVAALDKKTRIKAAYGIYKQQPIYIQNGGALDETYGNPDLQPELSAHYILGFERELSKDIFFRVEGFYKKYDNLVSEDPDRSINYLNSAERRAYGFDVFLQKKISGWIDGWITYSYIKVEQRINERSDPALFNRPEYATPLGSWYLPEFDRPHNLSVILNFRLSKRWVLALSYTYSSGVLYTPLESVDSYTDGTSGETVYTPNFGEYNSARLESYQRLDIKLTMPFFGIKGFDFFIQAVNVFNSPNPSGVSYNTDYSEEKINKQLPFIGLVGFRWEF